MLVNLNRVLIYNARLRVLNGSIDRVVNEISYSIGIEFKSGWLTSASNGKLAKVGTLGNMKEADCLVIESLF